MAQVGTNEFKTGMKLEIDGHPYLLVANEFVKPGKGQAFNRTKLKSLLTSKVLEKTFKSGEKVDVADVFETKLRMLYQDHDGVVFMDDTSFEQYTIETENVGDAADWLKDDTLYDVIFYQNNPITITPPTFMELKITETAPGARGDTASGRVLKPAVVETGAQVQVPIFINEEEVCRFDTRTGEYVSRAG